jgi:nucleotide-binding universal stress UspA family protein
MFRKLLVPTDGSELARETGAAAINLAKEINASVVVVSILQPLAAIPFYEGVGVVGAGADNLMQAHARKQADEAVEAICSIGRSAGVKCEPRVLEADSISHGIVDAAKQGACDLIVIGTHGRRGLSNILMGSVTRSVLPYAHVPVLVWRNQEKDGFGAA